MLASHSNVFSKNISFDPSFSEFLLKNAFPLVSQIKGKSGLGYESLKSQLQAFGCHADVLTYLPFKKIKNEYDFHQFFINALNSCSDRNKVKMQQYEMQDLLGSKDAYLIVTGESLNSPMSYFGHSLLLFLDKRNFYFSPVLSVLAPTEGLSVFEQITKGGFSLIKAETNIVPLHQVIDFYNDQESRKLKFIKLPKSTFNTRKLIEFFNEKLEDKLNYNFFTLNCSTYLYKALSYSCNCLQADPFITTPVLLERQVQQDSKIESLFTIESLFDRFNSSYTALSSIEKRAAENMFLNSSRKELVADKAVGDVAVLASMLSFESYNRPNSSYKNLLDTYGKDDSLLESLPMPTAIDDTHLDGLFISSAKLSVGKENTHLTLSAIDFDHFEQRAHHFISSKLSAGSLELSQTKDSIQLESLGLVGIQSITPLNFVTRKPSWRLKVGVERNEKSSLEAFVSAGVGPAFSLSKFKLYSLFSIELNSSLKFPVYSGIQFNSEAISMKYELTNLTEHSLSFYQRAHSNLGIEYNVAKKDHFDTSHKLSLVYYF